MYYEVQKMVSGLGLLFQMVDLCIDNCMIFWMDDAHRTECQFFNKSRFHPTSGRTRDPYKRMSYLPIAGRLKRLYLSERTAALMRWHAKHYTDGEISHPSDTKVWKHFQSTYPWFDSE